MTGLSFAPIEVNMDNQLIVIFKELLNSKVKYTLCHDYFCGRCEFVVSCSYCPLSSTSFAKHPERNFPNQLFTVLEKLNG